MFSIVLNLFMFFKTSGYFSRKRMIKSLKRRFKAKKQNVCYVIKLATPIFRVNLNKIWLLCLYVLKNKNYFLNNSLFHLILKLYQSK